MDFYNKFIRSVLDFPIKGINFRDITPLLADGDAFHQVIMDLNKELTIEGKTVEAYLNDLSHSVLNQYLLYFYLNLHIHLQTKILTNRLFLLYLLH